MTPREQLQIYNAVHAALGAGQSSLATAAWEVLHRGGPRWKRRIARMVIDTSRGDEWSRLERAAAIARNVGLT